jgi:hypothetical protein
MLGIKRSRSASITTGTKLMHRIRKGQFKLGRLRIKDNRAPEIWNAVLAAKADSCSNEFDRTDSETLQRNREGRSVYSSPGSRSWTEVCTRDADRMASKFLPFLDLESKYD